MGLYPQRVSNEVKVRLDEMSQKLKMPKIKALDLSMNNQSVIIQSRYEPIPKSKDKKLVIIYKKEYLVKNGIR